jgi:hypothetical protein
MSLKPYRGRRTGREWVGIDLYDAMHNAHAIGDELLSKRRRCAAIRQSVLVPVPWAGHTAVDDASLTKRSILMGAKISERPDLRAVAEDRNAFAARRGDDARALVRYREG